MKLLFFNFFVFAFSKKMIFYAIHEGDVEKVEKLISEGHNINEQMEGSLQTPLMMAVLGGHLGIVTKLLELGADVTIPEKDGYTPMHGAGFQV